MGLLTRINGFFSTNVRQQKDPLALTIEELAAARETNVLAADVINANATPNTIADVTGLSFPVKAGVLYRFKFIIIHDSAAATTGARFSINGPASPTLLAYRSQYGLTLTSETINNGLGAYDLPAAAAASVPATTRNHAQIEGIIRPSVAGTVIARFASEITASAITAKAGSYVEFSEVV